MWQAPSVLCLEIVVLPLLILPGCHSSMDYSIKDTHLRVVEDISGRLASDDAPGVEYVVLDRESTLFSFAGGWADISGRRGMDSSTTMMIYSMSKTITAAAVLQLVDRGTLALDDPVSKYLQDIPYGDGITLRHLLSQTSGIPNPIPLKWAHLVEEDAGYDEDAALRRVLADNPGLDFPPGEKYAYSNISYWLLGRIISNVSGVPYEEYVRTNIFSRLHLPAAEIDFVIPSREHHARGYLRRWSFLNLLKPFVMDSKFFGEYEDGWLHIKDHYLNGPAFGGIVASARAVGGFLQDQLQDSSLLFSRGTKSWFFQQQRNAGGELIEMSLGWHVGTMDGATYFFKEGGGGGFHAEMRVYPSGGICSVVIANSTTFDAKGFLNAVDAEFLHR
jgi:CubicO group peptidase (beta-lactamase class C family)